MNMKERIQNSEYHFHSQYCETPLLRNPFCAQSSYTRHEGYGFCGYILGVPKGSSPLNHNLLYYLYIYCMHYFFYQPL